MTLTKTPETVNKASVPFCLAFGAALVVSSGLGAASPVTDWSGTWAQLSGFSGHIGETSTGRHFQAVAPAAKRNPSDTISELRAISGLTADQVGRLLDVSRRTVQNWIAGNAMAIQHEEKLSGLMSVIQSLPGSTSDERRAALLDSSNGQSLFQALLNKNAQSTKIQVQAVSAGERIAL